MLYRPLDGGSRLWEDLRREARKLEGDLDVRLAAYAKLCSGFESSVRADGPSAEQLAQAKAGEIEVGAPGAEGHQSLDWTVQQHGCCQRPS